MTSMGPEEARQDDDCLHPGTHCSPNRCIDCGRFSSHSWATRGVYGPDGYWMESWGGVCKVHGDWREDAA